MSSQPNERRLGRRHVLGPMAVRWRLDEGPPAGEERPDGPEPAGLLDLSVSGVRIMVRERDDLAPGDRTTVEIRGETGPVIVRRITPSTQPGFVTVGLEFADPMSPLPQLIHLELARRDAAKGTRRT